MKTKIRKQRAHCRLAFALTRDYTTDYIRAVHRNITIARHFARQIPKSDTIAITFRQLLTSLRYDERTTWKPFAERAPKARVCNFRVFLRGLLLL